MRRLWRAVYGRIVLFHADYWTGFERLREKYKPNDDIITRGGKRPPNPPGPPQAIEHIPAPPVGSGDGPVR